MLLAEPRPASTQKDVPSKAVTARGIGSMIQ